MKLTVNYTDASENKYIYTTYCKEKEYDINTNLGMATFRNGNEEFSVRLSNLVSFQYEETEGKSKNKDGNSKIKVKALKVTIDMYGKTVDSIFYDAFRERIIRPGLLNSYVFFILGCNKTACIGDYIIYKDGKFDVCDKEYFDKHYTC
ncbi:hypothetical protein [Clostridium butyricum]|uniref:hypothetical protein n=1 Tax=Clostridium butyricum TaxID=1492 RepID=UPI000903A32B|nr:hypothetical protein [Clostridium butyricum]APF21235.1 hypothetical protein NPD4_3554 [Clostridium butyricum]